MGHGLGHGIGHGIGYGVGHNIGFGIGHGGYGHGYGYGYGHGLGHGFGYGFGHDIGFGYGYSGYGYYSPYYNPYYGSYGAYSYPSYYGVGYGYPVYYDDSYTYSPVFIEGTDADSADHGFSPVTSSNDREHAVDERSNQEGLLVPRPLVSPEEPPEVLPPLNNDESPDHSHDEEKSDVKITCAGPTEGTTRT